MALVGPAAATEYLQPQVTVQLRDRSAEVPGIFLHQGGAVVEIPGA